MMSKSNIRIFRLEHRYFWATSCLLILLIVITPTAAADKASHAGRRYSGPYCGLFCLYSIMELSGKDSDIKELIKPEYIGSRKGSSLTELKKAAEDNGMYAVSVNKLTTKGLRQSPYPIILHVKSTMDKKNYNHFELYLGCKNGKARIFDPPDPVRSVPFHELAPRWDGSGLIVSDTPVEAGVVFAPDRQRLIVYTAIGIVIILIVHGIRGWWLPSSAIKTRLKLLWLSAAQCSGLTILAILGGMIYHFANNEGLLAQPDATDAIIKAHQGNFIPKVSKNKVCKLLNTDTVFIDARLTKDFEKGHLDEAINIPVNASDDERQQVISNIPKDSRIVIYCQSAGCKFAEKVAIKLISDDFNTVSIFKGGWNEWAAKNNDK